MFPRAFAETFISEEKNRLIDDTKTKLSLDALFSQIKAGSVKELPIIVKAHVQGSVEAVKQSLMKLSNEEVMVKVIHGGVGAINESDVSLASASNAIIIGFNIRPDATAKSIAEREKVDIRLYKVIYQAIEDVEAAMKGMLDPVFEEKKIPEMEVMFIMDRFGYARTIDMAAFERNKEAVFNENKYVIPVMNTDKICIFTDTGDLHQLKIKDLPFTKFRDKGTPIDNLCNYDSSKEIIVYITPFERLKNQKMLFVTRQGMMKLVDSEEFQVAKRTVACTKLADDDKLIGMYSTDARVEIYSKFSLDGEIKEEEVVESNQNVIVQTENGVFLKFPLTDIPMKKKSAVGVRGIKLSKDDYIEDVFLLTEGDEFTMEYKGKSISFAKMKTAHRDTKGTKIRV